MLTVQTLTTGEVPGQAFGHDFGGRDDFSFRDWSFSGNIDAPWYLPAGGSTNRNYDQVPAPLVLNRP